MASSWSPTASQPFIGVNYGDVADNLPPPPATARLLRSTTISKLRLYDTNPALVSAVSGTGISLLLGVANGDIPSLASSPAVAGAWVAAHLPADKSSVSSISVGNEVLTLGDPSLRPLLGPAMQNLASALTAAGAGRVAVSTVHSMAVLSQSDPPSTGRFLPDLDGALDPLLAILNLTASPFMVNPYPYFAYLSDPRSETLAFCLFQPNAGRPDADAKLTYTNMFDAQLDAVRAALDAKGYSGIPIVVAETGWPHHGDADEPGATTENARAYVSNLVAHLKSKAGTPRVPGRPVDTYIFALYDEDLKPGAASERSFGLFAANMTENYDAGLLLPQSAGGPEPSPSPSPTPLPSVVAPPRQGMSKSQPPAYGGSPRMTPGGCVTARGGAGNGGAADPVGGCTAIPGVSAAGCVAGRRSAMAAVALLAAALLRL